METSLISYYLDDAAQTRSWNVLRVSVCLSLRVMTEGVPGEIDCNAPSNRRTPQAKNNHRIIPSKRIQQSIVSRQKTSSRSVLLQRPFSSSSSTLAPSFKNNHISNPRPTLFNLILTYKVNLASQNIPLAAATMSNRGHFSTLDVSQCSLLLLSV